MAEPGLQEMASRNYAEMAAISRRLHASFRAVAAIGKPVVVSGPGQAKASRSLSATVVAVRDRRAACVSRSLRRYQVSYS